MKSPLPIRRLSASEASALSTLARRALDLPLPPGSGPARSNVSISLSSMDGHAPDPAGAHWVRLRDTDEDVEQPPAFSGASFKALHDLYANVLLWHARLPRDLGDGDAGSVAASLAHHYGGAHQGGW
jgi:hypothetical protein